jgi:RNA polymerase sigma factor for flagellar operon FliA
MNKSVAMYAQVEDTNESLVIAHMPMVKRVAIHLKARIPPFMEVDELVQVGMVGLIEASRSFNPTLGIPFEGFALTRIRGAMLDEVRRLSFLPRSAVAFNASENASGHTLMAELGRQPTQAELAAHMGKDLPSYHKERDAAQRFETYSLEVVTDEVMSMADDSDHQPEVVLEKAQMMNALEGAIEALPERERMVLQLYYVEGLILKEIVEVLGVTESRVSQILSGTVKKLRQQLQIT